MMSVDIPEELCYVCDSDPGIKRKAKKKKFVYYDQEGHRLTDKKELKRIESLVIPPAWTKVWICPIANGYLQSSGRDPKKRKQYIYHSDWLRYRQGQKFDKVSSFGKSLPSIRRKYNQLLKKEKWTKKKVLALTIKLIDDHYFRVGNQVYTEQNGSYGVTTLRRKHLKVDDDSLSISYKAKSGKQRSIKIDDKKMVKLVRKVSELPGYQLFTYRSKSGKRKSIDSSDVNQFLYKITGKKFTAKDFRTWAGSKLAIAHYEKAKNKAADNKKLKFETTLIKVVAKDLGNTVSVCRQYYIHPEILSYLNQHYPKSLKNRVRSKNNGLDSHERLLMDILQQQ